MYHPPSKRRQLVKRIVTYAFMSIAVVTLVTILVFVMLGYRYNQGDGRIEQGGLVQFDSQPNGAEVTIDGTVFGTHTPSKTTLAARNHTIKISRSGYQDWNKTVNLVAGAVLWLNYARLIPNQLTPENVTDFPAVSGATSSPDQKTMAIIEKADTPVIQLADVSGDSVKTTVLTLPDDSFTHPDAGKTQSFTLMDWDASSRYFLVKHTYNDAKIEWLLVGSRDASQTKNISRLFDVQASKVVFSGNDNRILYALIGTDVRKIDMGASTLSRPLVSNAAEFAIFDQTTIVYTTAYDATTGSRTVGYFEDGDQNATPISTFKDDGTAPLHIALGRYFGDMYTAIDHGNTVTITTGDLPTLSTPNPHQQTVATVTVSGGVDHLSIRTEGRFVIMQNQGTFVTYDLELKKQTTTVLHGTAPFTHELGWIDGYMPWSDRDGMLRLYEFDGANQHDIMPVVPGMTVDLSQNGKYLYGIGKSADGVYHLERVRLVLA